MRINDFLRNLPRAGRKARSIPKKIVQDEPQFTPRQLVERKKYARRLATEAWFVDLVCLRRYEKTGENWKPETIRQLAKNGYLGWADCLAFIYPRGTKYRRWPDKEFFWECDGSSLWRGELVAGAKHIYINESETDSIAMLDDGMEEEPGVAVIAVSGAGGFQKGWGEQFTRKTVTLCFDNDEAGIAGADCTGAILKPYVSRLFTFDMRRAA